MKLAWLAIALAALSGPGMAQQAPRVVLDTGHTPTRPGSKSAYGRMEYDFNRRLALLVAHELARRGIRVERVEGEYPLDKRTLTTRGAALFLSIHHDSIQQAWIDAGKREQYAGYSAFVSRKNAHFSPSLWCAQNIGWQMAKIGEKPSLYHQTPIPGENRPLLDASSGVHLFNDLVVLKNAQSPAVLVEAGVIANPHEDIRLGDDRVVARMAGAIAEGVAACLAPLPPAGAAR